MSKGGAAKRREGSDPAGRVTPPTPAPKPAQGVNWVVLIITLLILLGLVGSFFVALI